MKKSAAILLFSLSCLCAALLFGCSTKTDDTDQTKNENTTTEDENTVTYAKTILVDANLTTKEGEQYATLTEAFEYANENSPKSEDERIRILVSPGIYREHLILTAPYITLEGDTEDTEEVLLTWYYGCGRNYHSITAELSNPDSASVHITEEAHDFIGTHVTFENSYSLYVTEEEKTDYSKDNSVTLEQREKDVMNSKYKKQVLSERLPDGLFSRNHSPLWLFVHGLHSDTGSPI